MDVIQTSELSQTIASPTTPRIPPTSTPGVEPGGGKRDGGDGDRANTGKGKEGYSV